MLSLIKEKKNYFVVSCRDHNSRKKLGNWKRSQIFLRPEGQNNIQPRRSLNYKDQEKYLNEEEEACVTIVMIHAILLRIVCDWLVNILNN